MPEFLGTRPFHEVDMNHLMYLRGSALPDHVEPSIFVRKAGLRKTVKERVNRGVGRVLPVLR